MADTCSADSGVAWLWAIEYLASFKQIDPSILHDLIDEAPELPEDLGKNTREMVALKCLEHLFTNNTNEAPNDAPSVPNQKIKFDLNEACEDVLQSILKEMPVSDLKMAGPDLLKWDVPPFILHKRASMPKCALEQLKDAILEGTHPYAAFFGELSGLVHKNDENNRITVSCGTDSNGTDAQIMAPEGNNIHLPLENMNRMVRDDSCLKNLLPLKRNGNDLDNEHPSGDYQEDQGGMDESDLLLNAKKFKTNASCAKKSREQILISQPCNELVEDSSRMMVGDAQKESCHVERVAQIGLGECCSFGNGHGKFVATERLGGIPTADANNFQNNHSDRVNNANKKSEGTFGDGSHQCILDDEVNKAEPRASNGASSLRTPQEVSADDNKNNHDYGSQLRSPQVVSLSGFPRGTTVEKSEGGIENLYQEDTSSESGGYHHEMIDVAMEKSHFLSSQCTLSHASPSNWTELNLCVQCSKDGQLLVCNAVGCPFVVHEKCLGCSPKFDEKGNFYCPFCAYSYAISKYLEAKKTATLARKELSAFIHKRPERSHLQKLSNLGHNEDEDNICKIHETADLGERGSDKKNDKVRACIINGQVEKRIGDRQPEEPMLSCIDVNVMCREQLGATHGITHIASEANESEEMSPKSSFARGLDREDQTSAGLKSHGDNPMSKDKEMFSSNKEEAEGRFEKEVLEQQSSDVLEKPVCAGNVDEGETSDDESDENMMSDYSIRLRRRRMREIQYAYPATPQFRRKKVPWTAKEEEILKEGVQKFSNISDRTISWKKILEYGSAVFLHDRTTTDLKDKWRNICKGSPKCQ
ncbi:uncharacterized protein LOC8278948 isoform X1 [Ricinus communis]|uniref:uncharacterized protein LOC8278948 isoform X1 n=2 Tax=Ricinus communis TaxID=3988 RepID=UPI00201ABD5A|nr:uncharacterized protein LOC8278948 isoform X1 [Ricinus communis]